MGVAVLLFAACSTKNNTSSTRFYHAMTARFNTLHNGQMAFLEGQDAQEKGHRDDFNRLLPMYLSTNKATAAIGKGNYETAITKSEKAIKVHSIKKRPIVKGNKKKTQKQKNFLARKEFNPYLYRAWFMMGDAQFHRGDFFDAASTYNYMLRLYSTQPDVQGIAKAKLARCYVALGWAYDAEDLLGKMKRDTLSKTGLKERDNTEAGYLILTGQYENAIPYLKRTVRSTRGKLAKARLNFLLGQLYQEVGQPDMAYKAMSKVIRSNPPYEVAFNARILQTEVMPKSKYRQMISQLKRMAKSDKNKDYLDKVYYAMGNIYMNVADTTHCISSWERGVKEGTRNGSDKAMLLLRLSQLYWEQEKYIDAARTYKACVAILDKEHEEYKESDRRNKILTELEPHLSAIHLQDSLQALAKMPESDYLAAIDRVIAELKKQEKEDQKQANRTAMTGRTGTTPGANAATTPGGAGRRTPTTPTTAMGGQRGEWYFYNPATVSQGTQEFQRRWGQRKNTDFWRISNKSALVRDTQAERPAAEEIANDSLYGQVVDDTASEEEQQRKDSLANDPHHREFYLKQIPFTEEQMAASNAILSDGLYHGGILEQEKLENFPLAEKTMRRLLDEFPEREGLDNIYYHLFLLYGRMGNTELAEAYRQKLIVEYPDSKLAVLLANPNYELIARDGEHVEDSVYATAYTAYQASDYATVEDRYRYSQENFPVGKNRARMIFIRAMSQLYSGQRDSFLVSLKDVIQHFSSDDVAELARSYVKGLEGGRILMDDKYDASDIWARRSRQDSGDSTAAVPELTKERYGNFAFVLAYPTNSLDEDQLLYEMARYNFTSYMVRNFEIEIVEKQGLNMMMIHGFLSYDEVHAYAQQLYRDGYMSTRLEGIRTLLISEDNLKLLGTEYSFDEYKQFYEKTFAPLDVPEDLQLDEPTDLEVRDPDDVQPEKTTDRQDAEVEDDFPFGF